MMPTFLLPFYLRKKKNFESRKQLLTEAEGVGVEVDKPGTCSPMTLNLYSLPSEKTKCLKAENSGGEVLQQHQYYVINTSKLSGSLKVLWIPWN